MVVAFGVSWPLFDVPLREIARGGRHRPGLRRAARAGRVS
jgi:hypothetical protein